jgi:hypothetical protein
VDVSSNQRLKRTHIKPDTLILYRERIARATLNAVAAALHLCTNKRVTYMEKYLIYYYLKGTASVV